MTKIEFENSTLRKLKPTGLIDKNTNPRKLEIETLFLSLAMIFNDLKGLIVLLNCKDKVYKKADNQKPNCHAGEMFGITVQIIKYFSGILHETIKLLQSKQKIIHSQKFKQFENKLSTNKKDIWTLLLDIADIKRSEENKAGSAEQFRHLLLMIRNKTAFHYNDSVLLINGFSYFFYDKNNNTEASESAYYSSQRSDLLKTRYYYADAALTGFLSKEMDKMPRPDKTLDDIIVVGKIIAESILCLLEEYHKTKPQN